MFEVLVRPSNLLVRAPALGDVLDHKENRFLIARGLLDLTGAEQHYFAFDVFKLMFKLEVRELTSFR
ncbi:MAG TPA: hypothetical protein VKV15_05520 [Bryobacteraceae bacterium]|nr:hypothetical protein [Bryobacteraceae bacterium]